MLITGGSRGLGLVIARQLAAQGARIAICARDAEELSIAAGDIQTYGGEVFTMRCDLSVREEVQQMVTDIISHYGQIDVLINNAGTDHRGSDRVHAAGGLPLLDGQRSSGRRRTQRITSCRTCSTGEPDAL